MKKRMVKIQFKGHPATHRSYVAVVGSTKEVK